MTDVRIDTELQGFFRPLTAEELSDLEAALLRDGMTEPLYVWKGHGVLLDGHHRYALCQKHQIVYATQEIDVEDIDAAKLWMITHQRGRRQWTASEIDYYMGTRYELEKKKGFHGNQHTSASGTNYHQQKKTAETIAEDFKVSPKTVRNNAAFAKQVDVIAEAVPDARADILSRDAKMTHQQIKALSKIATASPQAAKHVLADIQAAPTPKDVKRVVHEAVKALPKAPVPLTLVAQEPTADEGIEEIKTADGRTLYIVHAPGVKSVFNKTNEMVDWAAQTWNPVTGCWHDCAYCYARAIANDTRMAQIYPKQFEPTFHPHRLEAPANTPYPKVIERPADRNVFVCSMADLFGKWVPDDWITAVFERVRLHPEWNFLFLTKFPQRLVQVEKLIDGFPPNAWMGCTVDGQARVKTAERAFRTITASVKWVSVEPMLERLTFSDLAVFDWLVMGGQSASDFNGTPAVQPAWEWVEHLWQQARAAGVKVYWKENLTVRPKEVPAMPHEEALCPSV